MDVRVTSNVRLQNVKLSFFLENFINILESSPMRKRQRTHLEHAEKITGTQRENHGAVFVNVCRLWVYASKGIGGVTF